MEYEEFLNKKSFLNIDAGFNPESPSFPVSMFDFQKDLVLWALRRGRAALFCDTGLGKTIMQLTWADNVSKHTNKPILILAPLCVSQQTVREGIKFGIDSCYTRDDSCVVDNTTGIYITNYEMLKNFNADKFSGIVIDESSILKGMNGKLRQSITDFASVIPYRLSCTATPSPNDFMELGTQSEFLGVMSQVEMLAMFFIHDGSETQKWRLKGHGRVRFWEWLSTWSCVIRNPADLGYDGSGYDLPPIEYHEHIVETDPDDGLFVDVAMGLQDRNKARKESVDDRVKIAADIANSYDEPVLVWCNLNDEGDKLEKLIDGAVNVYGSMKPELKEKNLLNFTDCELDKLISKPSISGFGMNWQHCNKMIFVGLSDSWEKYYQAIRRCYRFGQKNTVHVHIVSADTEGAVVENIKRKEKQNKEMGMQMVSHMKGFMDKEIRGITIEKSDYTPLVEVNINNFLKA